MSFESPISVLQNLAGDEVAIVSGSAMGSTQPGVAILAKDESGNAQFLNLNASGELKVQATVDVALSASTDSILVYGSADVALQQDGDHANSLKTYDQYVSGAIDNMGTDLSAKLTTLDTSVSDASDAIVAALTGSVSGAINALGEQFKFESDRLMVSGSVTIENPFDGVVSATDLDIRDLAHASDSVAVYGSEAVALQQDSARVNSLKTYDAYVSGAIDNLGADLSAKLNTLDTSVSDTSDAIVAALTGSVSGAINALGQQFKFESDRLMVSGSVTIENPFDGVVSATDLDIRDLAHATDSVKVYGSQDAALVQDAAKSNALTTYDQYVSGAIDELGAELSSSLGRFTFNGSNELLVNAAVDVELNYATDSITIYGDEAVPFAQISGSGEMITVPLGSEGNSLLQAASGSIHSDVNGNGALLVGLLGSNSKNVLQSSANDILLVSGAGDFNVVATDLDIRPLTSADVVTVDNMVDVSLLATEATLSAVSGAIDGLGASVDAVKAAVEAIDAAQLGTVTVSASDLDIRDLNSGTDSVSAVQSGDWIVRKHATSAAVSTASASTSDAEVLAANADRMGATFFMDGNATCYIKLGGAASSSDFSVRLVNNGYYELPEGFTGAIHAAFSITDAGIKLRITELSYA